MARVDFSARAPIGVVEIGGRKLFVFATDDMIRQLRVVRDSVNAVETGLTASAITNVPAGGIAATNVQVAIDELDTEKATTAALTSGLAGKQPLDATLTALAGLATGADKLVYATGADAFALTDLTSFARTLLDDSDAGTARATLGLVIGTNVQAWDADLDTWAGKTAPSGTVVGTSDTQTLSAKTLATPVVTGTEYTQQGAVTSKGAAATLTIAELLTRIIQYTGAAASLTLPTGSDIETGVMAGLANDRAFEFNVINTGSGTATIATAAGLTLVGAMTVTAGASGAFRVRKTATDTYTVYRIA